MAAHVVGQWQKLWKGLRAHPAPAHRLLAGVRMQVLRKSPRVIKVGGASHTVQKFVRGRHTRNVIFDVGKVARAKAFTDLLGVSGHVGFKVAPAGECLLTQLTLPGGHMAQQVLLKSGFPIQISNRSLFTKLLDPEKKHYLHFLANRLGLLKLKQKKRVRVPGAMFCALFG